MKTKKDYTTNFMGYGLITVPKGTSVTNQTICGINPNFHFVDTFNWAETNYPNIATPLIHDLTFEGLNVPKEYIEN